MQAHFGDIVKIHFTCRTKDGTIVVSSTGRDPLQCTLGKSEIIPYLEKVIIGMREGDFKTVKVPVSHAFGAYHDELVFDINRILLSVTGDVLPGTQIQMGDEVFKVINASGSVLTLDANYPLAGEDLFFDLHMIEISKNKSYTTNNIFNVPGQSNNIHQVNKIALLLTTFFRDNLMFKTIRNLLNYWDESYVLLIADQGCRTINDFDAKREALKQLTANNISFEYYQLPFDCGLSAARNFLVKKADAMNIRYCFLLADSIQFLAKYNLDPILSFLEEDNHRGIVGFDLYGRPPWDRDLELIKNSYFYLMFPKRKPIEYKNIRFQPVDICRNFFLAKTESLLLNLWDEDLKLCEHEDFFWRLKNEDKLNQVFWTDFVQAQYINEKSFLYDQLRNRMYFKFREVLLKKYSLTDWVRYE